MRNAPLVLALGAISLLVAGFAVTATDDPARASHGGPDVIGLDMDTTGNTATTLGTTEDCASVTAGTTVTLDLFITNVPPPSGGSGGIIGWQVQFLYDETPLSIASEDQNFLVYSGAGSGSPFSISEPLPDTDGSNGWLSSSLDTGSGTPESGSGVLSRITVDTTGAATGQYTLVLDPPASVMLDQSGAAFTAHTIAHGAIAIGQACGPVVTPSPTEPPPLTDTPSPPPVTDTPGGPTDTPTGGPTGQPGQTTAPPGGGSPTGTAGAGTGTPARTRTPTPAALPPTGLTDDGGGTAAPLAIGAGTLIALAMAYGGYEITRRLRREV